MRRRSIDRHGRGLGDGSSGRGSDRGPGALGLGALGPGALGLGMLGVAGQAGAALDTVSVDDWGAGFAVTFERTVERADLESAVAKRWRIDVGYGGRAALSQAFLVGHPGPVRVERAPTGRGLVLANDGDGYASGLRVGDRLRFTVIGRGAGYRASDFSIDFDDVTAYSDAALTSSLVEVDDWYDPRWGGGFNATFACAPDEAPGADESNPGFVVAFGHAGDAALERGWTNYSGTTEFGDFGPGGSHALRTLENERQPASVDWDAVTFSVFGRGGGFSADDFDVRCTYEAPPGGRVVAGVARLGALDAPLEDAQVSLSFPATGSTYAAVTGADGRFSIELDEREGAFVVEASGPDGGRGTARAELVPGPSQPELVVDVYRR